ncbi:Ras guanine nucleotide exchange factor K [Diplonema papillatum]|nr:Ras guanine nucleotide exchange factor K [Diplonema papillatum]
MEVDTDWEVALTSFFKAHNPQRVSSVPQLLQKHSGREKELLDRLGEKYGPGARSSLSPSSSQQPSHFRKRDPRDRQSRQSIKFTEPQVIHLTPQSSELAVSTASLAPHFGAPPPPPVAPKLTIEPPSAGNSPTVVLSPVQPTSKDGEPLNSSLSSRSKKQVSSRTVPRIGTLDSLVWMHLKSMGLTESAEAFENDGLVEANSSLSRMLAEFKEVTSPLQVLLGHHRTTDAVIDQLLKDTPSKLTASAHHFFDSDTMLHLIQMALQPMWTPPNKVHLKAGSQSMDIARSGSIRAASLNQLIERVTKVIYQPHVTQQREQQELDYQFVQAFLRTYKHFCAPHTLLAKMFQRWFVPMGFPFTDTYSNHYVMISSRQPATSARYWQVISAKVKYRVSSIILDWIRAFPEDWDDFMLHALEVFLDDNFYEPCPSHPYVHTQLLQFSDAIKVVMAQAVAQRAEAQPANMLLVDKQEGTDAGFPDDIPGYTLLSPDLEAAALATQLTAMDHEYLRKINVRELLDFTKNELHFLNLHAATSSPECPENMDPMAAFGPTSPHVPFISVSGQHHLLPDYQSTPGPSFLTNFPGSPVSQASTVGGTGCYPTTPKATRKRAGSAASDHGQHHHGGGPGGGNPAGKHRAAAAPGDDTLGWALGLSQFLQRSRNLQKWVVVELLTTSDDYERAAKMEKLITVAFKLLEQNNFQSCQSVVFALNHPTIQRMTGFLRSVNHIDNLTALTKAFVDTSSNGLIKKLLHEVSLDDKKENPPVPCLGVWVSDLQLIEEAEPTVVIDNGVGLIHWRKYQAVSTIFTQFSNVQNLVHSANPD